MKDDPKVSNDTGKMAQVSVTINGRQFRMACEDGQEGHLINLARELDARIGALRRKFGEIGDTRLTVMAAITVADELAEAAARIKRLEEEIAALESAQVATSDRNKAAQVAIASALGAAAERVESITKRLNQTIANSDVALG
jgi:cell division protein ZapA